MKYRLNRTSMRRFQLLSLLLLVFFCSDVSAQDSPEKKVITGPAEKTGTSVKEKEAEPVKDPGTGRANKKEIVKPENISDEKEKKRSTGKKIPPRALEVKPVKNGNKPAGFNSNDSILYINEGPYKYQRIPGYKPEIITKRNNDDEVRENELVRIPDKIEIEESKDVNGGFFGFKKETSDMLVKIFLGIMIFCIFLLYRIRSRKRSSKVLRRYPNR